MERKVDVGATLSEVFRTYGAQAGVLIPLALAFFLVVAVVSLIGGGVILGLIALIVSIAASTLYQGTVVQLVSDVQDGRRDSSAGELVQSATPYIVPLLIAGFIAGIGIAIGFVLLIIPGLILLTIWSVIAPVIVVEKKGAFESLGRSRELVRGNGWQVFGVIVIVFLITIVVTSILRGIADSIADSSVVGAIVSLIASSITAPIAALTAAVLYFQLRGAHQPGEAIAGGTPPAGAPATGVSTPGAVEGGTPAGDAPAEAPRPVGDAPPQAPPAGGDAPPQAPPASGGGAPDDPERPPPAQPGV